MSPRAPKRADRWHTYLRALYSDRFPLWDDTVRLLIFLKLQSRRGTTPPLTEIEVVDALRWSRNRVRLHAAKMQALSFLMLDWDLVLRSSDHVRANAYTVTEPEAWGVRSAKPCQH